MRMFLEPGTHLVHLAKLGSDFATGHGRLHQKIQEDIDRDGSHNSGFQTILLSKVTSHIYLTHLYLIVIIIPLVEVNFFYLLAIQRRKTIRSV